MELITNALIYGINNIYIELLDILYGGLHRELNLSTV